MSANPEGPPKECRMIDDWNASDLSIPNLEQLKQDYAFASWIKPGRAGSAFWIGFASLLGDFERHAVIRDRPFRRSDLDCDSTGFRLETADGSGFSVMLRECADTS